ncbi:hypothetical protein J2X71_006041 [Rhizobium sp. 1399]|nr:hypothetical protein [Rhizobium sp. 1399]
MLHHIRPAGHPPHVEDWTKDGIVNKQMDEARVLRVA